MDTEFRVLNVSERQASNLLVMWCKAIREEVTISGTLSTSEGSNEETTVRNRCYVRNNLVQNISLDFLQFQKGLLDVCMVYDGSGSNDVVWVPNSGLQIVDALLRGTGPTSWIVNLDVDDICFKTLCWQKKPDLLLELMFLLSF